MNPADFLPSFYRRAKRAVAPSQVDAAGNILTPDQTPIVAPVLAPMPPPNIAQPVPEVKPRASIPYSPPMPVTSPLATAPTSFPGLSEGVASEMGHVTSTKSGRVKPLPVEIDPNSEEKTLAVNKAYQTYDPEAQPAEGWHKWWPVAKRGLLRGFAAGGLGGAIFGGAEGALGGLFDPTRANREWQQEKLSETGPAVASIQKGRKAQADLEEQQAETEQRRMAPVIAANETERKRIYDQERLRIQEKVAAGRLSAAQATLKLRELDSKQRAEEGRLNREQRARDAELNRQTQKEIAGMPQRPTSPANAEPKRAAKLKEAEDIKSSAEIYDNNAKTNDELADAEPKETNDDGVKVDSSRAKELRKLAGEQREQARQLRAKIPGLISEANSTPTVSGSVAPTTHGFSISEYIRKNKGATEADAKAFAAKNFPGFQIVQ